MVGSLVIGLVADRGKTAYARGQGWAFTSRMHFLEECGVHVLLGLVGPCGLFRITNLGLMHVYPLYCA